MEILEKIVLGVVAIAVLACVFMCIVTALLWNDKIDWEWLPPGWTCILFGLGAITGIGIIFWRCKKNKEITSQEEEEITSQKEEEELLRSRQNLSNADIEVLEALYERRGWGDGGDSSAGSRPNATAVAFQFGITHDGTGVTEDEVNNPNGGEDD